MIVFLVLMFSITNSFAFFSNTYYFFLEETWNYNETTGFVTPIFGDTQSNILQINSTIALYNGSEIATLADLAALNVTGGNGSSVWDQDPITKEINYSIGNVSIAQTLKLGTNYSIYQNGTDIVFEFG